jgi:thiamine biosynthesis lipoprotein
MKEKCLNIKFKGMGSPCEITLRGSPNEEETLTALQQEVSRLEQKYSRFLKNSVLNAINASAGDPRGFTVDEETLAIFQHAAACYDQSDGLFDITAGPLNKIWDYRKAIVPDKNTIEETLQNVGFKRIAIKDRKVFLPSGMELDFGGIVKEYAADRLATIANKNSNLMGLINLGGDFAVIGSKHTKYKPWKVGISCPKRPSVAIAEIALHHGGLASSGDYLRCFELHGKRYSHLLNPVTGYPSTGWQSVSIAAPSCLLAGSIATIAMLKPLQESSDFLRDAGLAFVAVDPDGKMLTNLE